jgi:hypothetical protein
VTYVLQECDGPLSLTNATGTVIATFVGNTAGPEVQISSTDFAVDGVPVALSQTATIGSSGATRTLALTSDTVQGDMPAGSRTLTASVTWTPGTPCLTVNGTGTETYNAMPYAIMVNNVERCSAQCPTTGSVTSSVASSSTTLTFNGTAKAQAINQSGTTASVTLTCP